MPALGHIIMLLNTHGKMLASESPAGLDFHVRNGNVELLKVGCRSLIVDDGFSSVFHAGDQVSKSL